MGGVSGRSSGSRYGGRSVSRIACSCGKPSRNVAMTRRAGWEPRRWCRSHVERDCAAARGESRSSEPGPLSSCCFCPSSRPSRQHYGANRKAGVRPVVQRHAALGAATRPAVQGDTQCSRHRPPVRATVPLDRRRRLGRSLPPSDNMDLNRASRSSIRDL